MRCETCHGLGVLTVAWGQWRRRVDVAPYPCLDCGSSGISHCCDGLVATVDMVRLEVLHAEMERGLVEDGGDWPVYTGDGE